MTEKGKLVLGFGINDSGYPVNAHAVIDGKHKKVWTCPIYRAWKNMLARCYSAKTQARQPTYAGCSVAHEWRSFSAFREWMLGQQWEGNQLDKDILAQGGKVYSPGSCVFVSGDLNNFMNDRGSSRGEWPLGVNWDKARGKFQAKCCNPFTTKQEYLGLFTDPIEAHEAWRARKHEMACIYADQQTDPRIAAALRTRYATQKGKADGEV